MNTTRFLRRPLAVSAALAMALLLSACASKGVAPTAQLATARASVAQAEGVGARDAAPLELLSARDKLRQAETATREERFAQATQLAEQAEVDAELAERKARAAKAQAAATELARGNEMLRSEAERKTAP